MSFVDARLGSAVAHIAPELRGSGTWVRTDERIAEDQRTHLRWVIEAMVNADSDDSPVVKADDLPARICGTASYSRPSLHRVMLHFECLVQCLAEQQNPERSRYLMRCSPYDDELDAVRDRLAFLLPQAVRNRIQWAYNFGLAEQRRSTFAYSFLLDAREIKPHDNFVEAESEIAALTPVDLQQMDESELQAMVSLLARDLELLEQYVRSPAFLLGYERDESIDAGLFRDANEKVGGKRRRQRSWVDELGLKETAVKTSVVVLDVIPTGPMQFTPNEEGPETLTFPGLLLPL